MGEVTDPDLLAMLEGKPGKSGMSGAENQELKAARQANQDARSIFPSLAATYRVAARYPGGIPNTVKDRGFLAFGGQGQQEQDYDFFKAMATRAAIAKAKLLGTNPTNKDMEYTLQAGANPSNRFANNQALIGLDYEAAARKYFENAFKQRWAAKNGGLNGKDKAGMTYPEALSHAMRSPTVAPLLIAPWNRKPAPTQTGSDVKFLGFE